MFGNPNQSFQVFSDPSAVTAKAVGAVPGQRFVKLVAGGTFQEPHVALCGAGEQAFGVSGWDVVDGEMVTIQQSNTWTVTAGAAIVAPKQIASDAAGKAVAANGTTDKVLGQAHADAALNADAAVRLSI
jgi:hypothetical protein